jgi:hypothetical protein
LGQEGRQLHDARHLLAVLVTAGSCALVAPRLGDVSVDVLQVGTGVELFWLPRQPET